MRDKFNLYFFIDGNAEIIANVKMLQKEDYGFRKINERTKVLLDIEQNACRRQIRNPSTRM